MNKYKLSLLLVAPALLITSCGNRPGNNASGSTSQEIRYLLPSKMEDNEGAKITFTYDDDLLGFTQIEEEFDDGIRIYSIKDVFRYSSDYKTLTHYYFEYDADDVGDLTLDYAEKIVKYFENNKKTSSYYTYDKLADEYSLDNMKTYTYNDHGDLLEEKQVNYYLGEPYVHHKDTYKYDDQYRCIENKYYIYKEEDRNELYLESEYICIYSDDEAKETITYYNEDSTISYINKYIIEYSYENGNKVEHLLCYEVPGEPETMNYETITVYNSKGEFLSHTSLSYGYSGLFTHGSKIVRELDENGNVTKYESYSAKAKETFTQNYSKTFEYDQNNNVIRCNSESFDEIPHPKERSQATYNEFNQIVTVQSDVYDYSSEAYVPELNITITYSSLVNNKLYDLMTYKNALKEVINAGIDPSSKY